MPEPSRGLTHHDAEKKTDDVLRQEARAHLSKQSSVQLVAELFSKLRALSPPFWTPERLRASWSAADRMRWLAQRPDLRQQITTNLTGLAPKAARKKAPEFQAALIDSVIDDGDIRVDRFEEAFEPVDLAVYGPPVELWRQFRERMPWNEETQLNVDMTAWLLRALLTEKSSFDGVTRRPILTAWDIRTAIDGKVWHTRMPLDVRVAIDDARLSQEKARPGETFHAHHDLAIAVPELIAANIPLRDLTQVLARAERAMGFEPTPPEPSASRPSAGAGTPSGRPETLRASGPPPDLGGPVARALDLARPGSIVDPSKLGAAPEPPSVDTARPSARPAEVTRASGRPEPAKTERGVSSGDGSPKAGEVPAIGAGRGGSVLPSAPPAGSSVQQRSISDLPAARDSAPGPPTDATPVQGAVPSMGLLEDDDLERTNPWKVPPDTEMQIVDWDTTNSGETRPRAQETPKKRPGRG